jgi:hypothetical protein
VNGKGRGKAEFYSSPLPEAGSGRRVSHDDSDESIRVSRSVGRGIWDHPAADLEGILNSFFVLKTLNGIKEVPPGLLPRTSNLDTPAHHFPYTGNGIGGYLEDDYLLLRMTH